MLSDALVDAHVHVYRDRATGQKARNAYHIWEYGTDPGVMFADAAGDLSELLTTYGSANFTGLVVLHLFDSAEARESVLGDQDSNLKPDEDALNTMVGEAMRKANLEMMKLASALPMAQVLVSVDPTVLSRKELVDHLSDLVRAGIGGIKMHPILQGVDMTDPRMFPIYDMCSEAGLVVLSHSGPGRSGDISARPSEFAPVLERWPELRVVLAHLGGAAWRESSELADAFPQVSFDLSEIIEWVGAPGAPSSRELVELVRQIGADRVMLGSDFPWYDPVRTVERVVSLPGLGIEERAAVLGASAIRIYGLA